MINDKLLIILLAVGLFILGIEIGASFSFFTPQEVFIVTEKIVEVEKPIITQRIVEVVKEVEVYKFIDESNPVHKWIDPDNQAVVYIYPEGYTGEVMPMYALVHPVWFDQILLKILNMNDGVIPPDILNSIPKEWLEAVAPNTQSITSLQFDY